jgi:ribosomal-protein-alanine N-acetyltransferase
VIPRGLTLRPIATEDLDAVAAIHVSAFHGQGDDALSLARTSLHEELGRPWAHVWVACVDERAIGAFVAWVVADEVHVLDVATHPDRRRQGVGRALVNELLALARRQRALHMYLEVRRSNVAAIALYRGVGFAAVGVRARYYANDEDAIEMALALDPETGDVLARADEVPDV